MNSSTQALVTAAANTSKEVIGAQIVTQTLDALNKTAPSKGKTGSVGAQVVNKTLDIMNKRGKGKYSSAADGMAASYDFNKSVLSAVYNPTGGIANLKG